jgi:hypothetical protein
VAPFAAHTVGIGTFTAEAHSKRNRPGGCISILCGRELKCCQLAIVLARGPFVRVKIIRRGQRPKDVLSSSRGLTCESTSGRELFKALSPDIAQIDSGIPDLKVEVLSPDSDPVAAGTRRIVAVVKPVTCSDKESIRL